MKRLPIKAARDIAMKYDLDQVILLGWSRVRRMSWTVTFGRSVVDSEQAAMGGNRVKKALGWPETLCEAIPRRVVAAVAKETEAIANWLDLGAVISFGDGDERTAREIQRMANAIRSGEWKRKPEGGP